MQELEVMINIYSSLGDYFLYLNNLRFGSKIIAVPMEPVPLCQQKHCHFTTTSEQVHLDDFMFYILNLINIEYFNFYK